MTAKPFGELNNTLGESLDYAFQSGGSESKDLVILCHGVTGNKDRPLLVALADALQAAGINSLRFSFSGNGASEGKFTDATISKEVADLNAVIDRLTNEGYRLAYVGHSMGGAVGVLQSSQDPRIEALVSLAGMVYTKDFAKREFGDVKPDAGFMWDEPTCPLSSEYVNDLSQIENVLEAGSNISVPWLLLHGTDDDVVPIKDSKDIFAKASCSKKFVDIAGSDHVFSEAATIPMTATVVKWIRQNFIR